ncbi:myosin-binding protein 3-like [Gastrolobium bilobum]|uniref:myosin-binding protein 3-like n=1 Tax=Gastrolobium bilobum TaxID=150636 RepID=UPI002AAFDF87|nr:myosin-binding protein 3-like [Gastrolobium bilobum]
MQMQTLGRFCLLVAGHSVLGLYHRFLRLSLGFLLMDFPSTFKFLTQASEVGCGFVLLGYFSRLFNVVGIILIFGFLMRIMRSGWTSKDLLQFLSEFGGTPRFRSEVPGAKVATLERDPLKSSSSSLGNKKGSHAEDGVEEKDDEDLEDETFDVMALRKMVKMERQRFNAACAEIEKERGAASSAAEEAMAMILRLQSEKSSVEIQANQFRRMVEQKQDYDQEVIESLRWTVMQHESQKSLLEDQLGIYREKLSQYMTDDEIDQLEGVDATRGFLNFSVESDHLDSS